MGKIKKGILGGFSGTVGNVVGSSWKGISYMRSLPQSVNNPRTEKQVDQRTKFAVAMCYLRPMTTLLRTGWKLYAHRCSAVNAAMSYTVKNAVSGTFPDYSVDPSKVLVSRGNLTPACNVTAILDGTDLTLSWDDNSSGDSANQTDVTLIAILNEARSEAVTDTAGAERMEGAQTLTVPESWAGDTAHVWLGFMSEDGTEMANSLYVGSIDIA